MESEEVADDDDDDLARQRSSTEGFMRTDSLHPLTPVLSANLFLAQARVSWLWSLSLSLQIKIVAVSQCAACRVIICQFGARSSCQPTDQRPAFVASINNTPTVIDVIGDALSVTVNLSQCRTSSVILASLEPLAKTLTYSVRACAGCCRAQ